MKINSYSTQNFKGYDAVPLKNIYMQAIKEPSQAEIARELDEIGKKEDFGLRIYQDNKIYDHYTDEIKYTERFSTRWAQDDKHFIDTKDGTVLLIPGRNNYNCTRQIGASLKRLMPNIQESDFLTPGGNLFIGKKLDGEKWMIVGRDDYTKIKDEGYDPIDGISRDYGIKKANIRVLTQPDFHLDMAIRPIGYPFILVNDKEIVYNNLMKASENAKDPKEARKLREKALNYYCKISYQINQYSRNSYANTDKTVKELEKAGFIPIRIGGIYGIDINFMNAIVNKHADGTISYITNSTKYGTEEEERLEQIFEEELRRKVPNLRDVYFVSGGKDEKGQANAIMRHLEEYKGGLHCLVTEEPNFETWM